MRLSVVLLVCCASALMAVSPIGLVVLPGVPPLRAQTNATLKVSASSGIISPVEETGELPSSALPARSRDDGLGQEDADSVKATLADIAGMAVGKHDWPQWGGSNFRMNTPLGKNIPIDWDIGDYAYNEMGAYPRTGRVPNGARNIKWVVPLGSQTYGNPVVANGRIFIGTNNGARYIHRLAGDLGVLLCFDEQTGRFLWQHSSRKLATGRVNDWPEQGVCSTPVVDGNRLWYVSNRGEVVCLDTEGFYDDEDDGIAARDEAIGKWVSILEVPAVLQNDLPKLRAAFAKAGTELHRWVRIRRTADRRTLGRNARNARTRKYEWIPEYELRIENGDLHAFALSADADRKPLREVFSANNDLFPELRNNQLGDTLRNMISIHVNGFPDEVSLTVLQADREWEFQGELNGQRRVFRMTRENEKLSISKQLMVNERDEADVVWKLDMINELGVFPHNMSTCSVLTANGKLFVCTSNGVDEAHVNMPSPRAPSFMALDRETGKVLWQDNSPLDKVLHGQWASPSYGVFKGQAQVIFPAGDGWLYSFDPEGDGKGKPRLLWKFDANPKETKWTLGGRGTRNNLVAFPAIYDGLIYVAVGQDPEHGEGPGHLWCIDPTLRIDGGDVSAELVVGKDGKVLTERPAAANGLGRDERAVPNPNSAARWHFTGGDVNGDGKIEGEEAFYRSLSTPVIKDDILYISDQTGFLHCLDAKTGKAYWNFDLFAACWGSPILVDGHVFLGDEDGDMHIFKHSADPRIAILKSNKPEWSDGRVVIFESSMYGTPIVANNVLYVATRSSLFAIEHDMDAEAQPR